MRNKKASGGGILVIRLGAVGDVVRTFPALSLLKAYMPEARLCYMTEEDSLKLLEKSPILDEVLLFPRRRLSSLAKRPFGAVRTFLETLAFIKNLRKSASRLSSTCTGFLNQG